jgi:hypothetical protein
VTAAQLLAGNGNAAGVLADLQSEFAIAAGSAPVGEDLLVVTASSNNPNVWGVYEWISDGDDTFDAGDQLILIGVVQSNAQLTALDFSLV